MIFINKLVFVVTDDDNVVRKEVEFIKKDNSYMFNYDDEVITFYCDGNRFDFIKNGIDNVLDIHYDGTEVKSTILLKSENVDIDLPIILVGYLFNDGGAEFQYKIDGAPNLHSIKFIY